MNIKFPQVEVDLSSVDGNAFAIMGTVVRAMRRAKIPEESVQKYLTEAMSLDYNNLLRVTMDTVSIIMEDQ